MYHLPACRCASDVIVFTEPEERAGNSVPDGEEAESGRSKPCGCISRAASSGQKKFSKGICNPHMGFVGAGEVT